MVYRHIYWGRLQVGPNEFNMLTDAVKAKTYLVKIVTPASYHTKEAAEKDDMEYHFDVFDEEAFMVGLPKALQKAGMQGDLPCDCPLFDAIDVIDQNEWTRYRLIRIKDAKKAQGKIDLETFDGGKPSGKNWKKLFPARGVYPIEKVAWSIIALPDVDSEVSGHADTCKQGS